MAVDVSQVSYFAPILAYLLVAVVVGAILWKTKLLGDSKWFAIFIALFIATLFISVGGVRAFVQTIVPWFALLMVSLFFLLLIIAFVGKPAKAMTKGIGIAAVVFFVIIFLVSGFFVYSDIVVKYIPGPFYGQGADPSVLYFANWLYSSRVVGGILLLLASALVAWILTRK